MRVGPAVLSPPSGRACPSRLAPRPAPPGNGAVTANAADHGSASPMNGTSVSKSAPVSYKTVFGRSFDNTTTVTYAVNASWIDGDALCTPGERAPCYDEEGTRLTCWSNTSYPVDELNSPSTCLVAAR